MNIATTTSSPRHFYIKLSEVGFLLLLWGLLYVEPLQVGALKISQMWKATAVILMLLVSVRRSLPLWFLFGAMFSAKFLIYTEMPYGYILAVGDFLEELIFPVLCLFLLKRYAGRKDASFQLNRLALIFCIFTICSAAPFLLGLHSLNPERSLEIYGLDAQPANGIFYQIAVSSQTYCAATLILIAGYPYFSESMLSRVLVGSVIILGGYLVYASFTRTGWIVFLSGIAFVLIYGGRIRFSRMVVGAFVTCAVMAMALLFYFNNQAMQLRMAGGASYRQNVELSVSGLLSARLPFIGVAIDNLREGGFPAFLMGYGTQTAIDLFYKKTGMAIVSHNRTFEILESAGVVALLLYFVFIILLWRKSRARKGDPPVQRALYSTAVFLFLAYYSTSHGMPLWVGAMVAMICVSNIFLRQDPRMRLGMR